MAKKFQKVEKRKKERKKEKRKKERKSLIQTSCKNKTFKKMKSNFFERIMWKWQIPKEGKNA